MGKPLSDDIRKAIKDRYLELKASGASAIQKTVCEEFDVTRWTVSDIVNGRGLRNSGLPNPDGISEHEIKGRSVLLDGEGNVKLQWVKTQKDDSVKLADALFENFKKDLPQLPKRIVPKGKKFSQDLLSVIPFGDPHIGLYSWARETGADFDLEIAVRDLCLAVRRLVETAPEAEHCLIVNCGDYYHSDSQEERTARSKHQLDVDGRWAKVLDAGLWAMRQCIEAALERHKTVTVINAIGNHDDHSSTFLTRFLYHLYSKEPRVTINDAPTSVHYHEFGKVMLAVTHGHTIKMASLPAVAAAEQHKMWGRTEFRYGITGHIHHDSVKEYAGMKVESFRTLSARDAYAASMGLSSGRDMKCLVFHKDFGEIERHTVSVEMLRSLYECKD